MTVGYKSAKEVAVSEEVYARIIAYMNHFQPMTVSLIQLSELINVTYTTKVKSLVRKALKCELFREYGLAQVSREMIEAFPDMNLGAEWPVEPRLVRLGCARHPSLGGPYSRSYHPFSRNMEAMFLPEDRWGDKLMGRVRARWSQDEVRSTWEPYPEKFKGWWEKPAIAPMVALGRF